MDEQDEVKMTVAEAIEIQSEQIKVILNRLPQKYHTRFHDLVAEATFADAEIIDYDALMTVKQVDHFVPRGKELIKMENLVKQGF